MAAKPRIRICTDGRIGWPDVVQYEIVDGPYAGRRLTCRPLSTGKYEDPAWRRFQRRGYAYRIIVHDHAAYERLCQTNEIYDPRHTGAGQAVDNRLAPGA